MNVHIVIVESRGNYGLKITVTALSNSYGNFSLVDGMKFIHTSNKTKMLEHKLVSFAAVVALLILVTLLMKLVHTPLKWKYIL